MFAVVAYDLNEYQLFGVRVFQSEEKAKEEALSFVKEFIGLYKLEIDEGEIEISDSGWSLWIESVLDVQISRVIIQ